MPHVVLEGTFFLIRIVKHYVMVGGIEETTQQGKVTSMFKEWRARNGRCNVQLQQSPCTHGCAGILSTWNEPKLYMRVWIKLDLILMVW